MAVPVTSTAMDCYQFADIDTACNILAKHGPPPPLAWKEWVVAGSCLQFRLSVVLSCEYLMFPFFFFCFGDSH
jgi:hypothetical protein